MSNYNRSIDFTAKDALSQGDPNKVIKGSDMDSELDLVGAASSTKANKIIPAAVGNVPKLSGTGDLEDSTVTLVELQVLDGATVSTAELNILDGATLDVTELNYVDGVTSDIQTQLDAKVTSPVVTTDITDANVTTAKLESGEQMTTANVLGSIAGLTVGEVGSFAWLARSVTSSAVTAGSTYAGSGLRYAGLGLHDSTSGQQVHTVGGGATPSGTWRALGTQGGIAGYYSSTLFVRIS